MTRVKGGTISRARHKKVLKQAKGYFGSKHRLFKSANEQVMHSGKYAYRDRKQKKRDFRKLWITRINAACRENGISYSKFINGLTNNGITINRKMLSEIAINDKEAFAKLVELASKETKKAVNETKKVATTKEVTKAVVENTNENNDLASKTVAELRQLAKEREISGFSTMKKQELIDALNN